jgi:dinuclear metal center YbgI/SA1388 family protein
MVIKELINKLDEFAPRELADLWESDPTDNVGLMVGDEDREITGVLVSLDFDSGVLEQAINEGANFIITHHPMIFCPIRKVTDDLILKTIENKIAVFSMHTNLDWCKGGVNDCLAEKLGLTTVKPLKDEWIGRMGEFAKEMPLGEFVKVVRDRLGGNPKFVGDVTKIVKRVALCGGGGNSLIGDAMDVGCDVFVTADVPFHVGKKAWEANMALIDAGHFETENTVTEPLAERIKEWYNGKVIIGYRNNSYWNYNI